MSEPEVQIDAEDIADFLAGRSDLLFPRQGQETVQSLPSLHRQLLKSIARHSDRRPRDEQPEGECYGYGVGDIEPRHIPGAQGTVEAALADSRSVPRQIG